MDIPSCYIPPIALGLLNEAGELIVFDEVRGAQLLAVVSAGKHMARDVITSRSITDSCVISAFLRS